jgi:hypothetical protein
MWLGLCLMLTISGASGKTFRGASNDPPPLGCKAKIKTPKLTPKLIPKLASNMVRF